MAKALVEAHLAIDAEEANGYRSRLAFGSQVLWQPPSPTVIRFLRSMGVCRASQNLHLSFALTNRWGCAGSATTSTRLLGLAFDGYAPCQPSPPLVLRLWHLMSLCRASHHLHPLSLVFWVSRSMGLRRAGPHLHPSFTFGVQWVYAVPALTSTHCLPLAFGWPAPC